LPEQTTSECEQTVPDLGVANGGGTVSLRRDSRPDHPPVAPPRRRRGGARAGRPGFSRGRWSPDL